MEIYIEAYDTQLGYQGIFQLHRESSGEFYWRYVVGTYSVGPNLNKCFSPQRTLYHDKFQSCGDAEFDDLDLSEEIK